MDLKEAKIITAMVTPFDEKGAIAFEQLPKLVEHLLAHHTQGLILAGTTGESPTLTHDEEFELFQEVIKLVDGRVPLICGVGTNDTRDSVNFVREVAKVPGIAAGLAVVPYYNRPNQEGLYQHFKTISEASDLPIILYNVPGRTADNLTVETTLRLAELPNIIGIKECQGLDALTEIVAGAPEDFLVFTGEDSLAFPAYAVGANGVISVASHLLGNEIHSMYAALDRGDVKEAARLQRFLLPRMNALFSVSSPAPVKALLNRQGINVGPLRLPLVPCSEEEAAGIFKVFDQKK